MELLTLRAKHVVVIVTLLNMRTEAYIALSLAMGTRVCYACGGLKLTVQMATFANSG